MSSMKRLQNDINLKEDISDRQIPNEYYYIILIQPSNKSSTTALAKKLLISENKPLCAYVYGTSIYLLFSAVEDGQHHLSGNHHALCSKYTSLAVLELGCEVMTKIIEIETRTKVLVYFYSKICENMKQTAMIKSNGKIEKKDLTQLTFGEIKKELMSRCSIAWDNIPNEEKYGTIYKYISTPKPKYSALSEMINLSMPDKYIAYIFE